MGDATDAITPDLIRLIREKADLLSALHGANVAIGRARTCLTPGMRTGTSEACAVLDVASDAVSKALRAGFGSY